MNSKRNISDGTMTIATLNVRGLNDAKLEFVIQSFVPEERDILFLIDTKLNHDWGDYMEKSIKRRLGSGTRTHTCPCIIDYKTDKVNGFGRQKAS